MFNKFDLYQSAKPVCVKNLLRLPFYKYYFSNFKKATAGSSTAVLVRYYKLVSFIFFLFVEAGLNIPIIKDQDDKKVQHLKNIMA